MKQLTLLILSILLAVSCNKDEDDDDKTPLHINPNIEGFWMGNWQSDQEYQGTYIAEVEIDDDEIEGDVSIVIHQPNLEWYTLDLDAPMKDNNYSIQMNISGVIINVEGSIVDDAELTGQFTVPSIDLNGHYEGEKITEQNIQVNLLHQYQFENVGSSVSDIICMNNELWVLKYPEDYDMETGAQYPVDVLNTVSGEIESETTIQSLGISYNRAGNNIYSIYNGSDLIKYNLSGEIMDTLPMPIDGFTVIGNGSKLYFTYNFYQLLETDNDLTITDTTAIWRIPNHTATMFNGGFLVVDQNNIFKTDIAGTISYVAPLGFNHYVSKIVSNNTDVFLLVEEYNDNTEDWSYKIYKIVGLE